MGPQTDQSITFFSFSLTYFSLTNISVYWELEQLDQTILQLITIIYENTVEIVAPFPYMFIMCFNNSNNCNF